MADLTYPGLSVPISVPEDSVEAFIQQGWKVALAPAVAPLVAPPVFNPPPTSGPGSGVKAWQKYKEELRIATAEDLELNRDELIASVVAAGFPVE